MSFIGGIVLFIVVYAIIIMVAKRNANHNYTLGSGMFKNSENNLQKKNIWIPLIITIMTITVFSNNVGNKISE